jgi:uncharacterized C2H2 Zn-finger protein
VSTETASPGPHLSCPTCGAVLRARPSVTPGRSWVAMLPCPRCGVYAAHTVAADGTPRAWLVSSGVEGEDPGRRG